MPLTAKGEKILAAMQEQYGEEEGKRVFYKSKNAGTISGVDAALTADKEFSEEQRKKLAKSGKAMPGGGFPIESEQDLKNAIHAIGRAKNPAAAKAHIKSRARARGLSKLIPDTWDAASLMDRVPPRLRRSPLRCASSGRNERLGTARRRS